jgi:radical SAM superfamily enzyme YgiQ (UPF0313 family)
MDPDFFAREFLADAAETILVVCTNESLPVAVLGARRLKEVAPDKRVIFAGVGVAGVGPSLLEEFPWIDVVAAGSYGKNGESASPETCAELVAHPGPWHDDIPGVIFRRNGEVVMSAPRPPRQDLADLPFPAYHLVDMTRYNVAVMRSSWGCPFRCGYCDRHRGGLLSLRPIDNLVAEVEHYVNLFEDSPVIFFYDETFTFKRERVMDFCRQLNRLGLDVKWSCTGRVDTVDEEMLQMMADAGCEIIYYGLESGADRVLQGVKGQYVNKLLTRRQAEKVVEATLQYMYVGAFFIWGFPLETLEEARMTLDFARQVEEMGGGVTVYTFSAWPLSEFYQKYKDRLVFQREVWEACWQQHLVNPRSREMVAGLIAAHRDIFPGFYTADDLIVEKLMLAQEMGFESNYSD